MASVGTARNSYWKTTNPIPSDPVYDKFSSSQTHTKVKLNNPIPKDPVYSSPRGNLFLDLFIYLWLFISGSIFS